VILACKYAVSIEILESLLVSLRNLWPLEQVKEYLERRDSQEMKAYDFCKLKKRSDLAVVLEEFVDTSKSVLDLGFKHIEGFDFKAECKVLFSKEITYIQKQIDIKS
jgi:dimeric dUTPase (all-alpha-NTP-PPase superfamily)